MPLDIETFSNTTGGSALFKALGHPLVQPLVSALVERLRRAGRVTIYDPAGHWRTVAALVDLAEVDVQAVFVQDVEHIGQNRLGHVTAPVTDIAKLIPDCLFVLAFDTQRVLGQIAHLVPAQTTVETLDSLRLPDGFLSDKRTYLAGINFATNFAFFREAGGHHTRLVTANYWGAYGATNPRMWCRLFDGAGQELATWEEALPAANGTIVLCSQAIRQRFGLPDFTGQLFLHVLGISGHDVVKYALDTWGDQPDILSCTHDANAWPADFYAGIPAPADGERVFIWVQNSHPVPIPSGSIRLSRMGAGPSVGLAQAIGPFATKPLDVTELLPDLVWPAQIEMEAGRYVARPRYEIHRANGRQRIAHPNVERTDLKPAPALPALTASHLGKGFIVAAPLLPPARYRSVALPTPMSTAQTRLPIQLAAYDSNGRRLIRHRPGELPRDHATAFNVNALMQEAGVAPPDSGHIELTYDFDAGSLADGWLHAIFRYEDLVSGHAAETSFGSHIFNTVLTWRSEPQSYAGRPPGLSTRLFLRLGQDKQDTLCHLIYPASTPWHATSQTEFLLMNRDGIECGRRVYNIACGGSLHFRYLKEFSEDLRRAAGPDAYILVRDATCRLFGYHGLLAGESAFSLDHMFGF